MSDLLIRRRNLLIRKQEEEMNIRAVCFEADGEQTVAITKVGSAPAITMQYSYDGVNWESWDLTPLPFGGDTKVYVRGVNNERFGYDSSNYNKITFSTDAFVYVSGIAEALLDGENELLTYNYDGILRNLFYQQTALRSAEGLRFEAMSVSSGCRTCYAYTFAGCTNLLYAPKALSLESFGDGYECAFMFQGCTSLLTVPTLPATTLSKYCYQYMFQGCTSLLTAPTLPATTLNQYCYEYMFQGCTSLLTAPKIMTMTTAHGSHKGMFANCTSLVNAPELPATNLGIGCYSAMFDGCTSLVNAPELPATTLNQYCYEYMFRSCKNIKSIKCRAKVKANLETKDWLNGVETSGTFYGHSEYGWSSGASGIPTTWTFEELTD